MTAVKEYKSQEIIGSDTTLSIFRVNEKNGIALHTHDFIEIVYIFGGQGTEYINGQAYAVKRGDLLFLNYGSNHAVSPDGFIDYVNICFHPEFVGKDIITKENAFSLLQLTAFDEIHKEEEDGVVRFLGKEREEVEHLLFTMLKEYRATLPGRETALQSCMNLLIVYLLRKLTVSDGETTPDLLLQIARYIEENPDADLSLPTLAKKCFYNPSYFSRAFKKSFGVSLSDYVRDRKISSALVLFDEGVLPAEKIAERCGFSSAAAFYRAYAKVRGENFSDYRGKKKS